MEMAYFLRVPDSSKRGFCIVTDSASNATVTPVKRSGNVAFATASRFVKKHPQQSLGNQNRDHAHAEHHRRRELSDVPGPTRGVLRVAGASQGSPR